MGWPFFTALPGPCVCVSCLARCGRGWSSPSQGLCVRLGRAVGPASGLVQVCLSCLSNALSGPLINALSGPDKPCLTMFLFLCAVGDYGYNSDAVVCVYALFANSWRL